MSGFRPEPEAFEHGHAPHAVFRGASALVRSPRAVSILKRVSRENPRHPRIRRKIEDDLLDVDLVGSQKQPSRSRAGTDNYVPPLGFGVENLHRAARHVVEVEVLPLDLAALLE